MSDFRTEITEQDPIVELKDAAGTVLARYANGRVFFLGKPGNGTPSIGCRAEELPLLLEQAHALAENGVVRERLEGAR